MGVSLHQFTLRKDEQAMLTGTEKTEAEPLQFDLAEAFTLMYRGMLHKISVLTVLFDPEAFFILTSLSNQPVDYQSFFDSTLS